MSNLIDNLSGLINNCKISKNAIIYCRSSTQKQNEHNHTSLETQTFVCKEYCKNNDFKVVSVILEVCSATKINNQKKLLEIINKNIDINLVIYDASRFSRNILEGIQLLTNCKNKNIIIHNVKDNYSTFRYQGFLNFVDGIKNSESESKLIGERIKTTLDRKRKLGEDLGNPKYGYKKHKINGKTKFIDDDYEQIIIDFAYNLYYGCTVNNANKFMNFLTGNNIKSLFTKPCTKIEYGNFTYKMISEFFNDNNIKNRKNQNWTTTQIQQLVKNKKNELNSCDLNIFVKKQFKEL